MQDAIYLLKPYLLMGGGAICMATAPNAIVVGGGLVLFFLGSMIFKMRRQK